MSDTLENYFIENVSDALLEQALEHCNDMYEKAQYSDVIGSSHQMWYWSSRANVVKREIAGRKVKYGRQDE